VYAVVEAERAPGLIAGFGAAALVVLAVGLVGELPAALAAALGALGACWAISAWTRGAGAPGGTVLVATAIFVAAELAFASLEQASVADEGELVARRMAGLAGRAAGALALASFLLAALGLNAGGGLLLEAVGVTATVGVLMLVFALARHEATGSER
jgi:hypothetical protein